MAEAEHHTMPSPRVRRHSSNQREDEIFEPPRQQQRQKSRKEEAKMSSTEYEEIGSPTTESERAFIEAVNKETIENTTHDPRSNLVIVEKLGQVDQNLYPDCELSNLNFRSESNIMGASEMQRQIYYGVLLTNAHEAINNHIEKHVILLGGPGSGKTVAANRYARLVLDHKVPALKQVEMVHYVKGNRLQNESLCKAHDLLFKQQLGSITDPDILHAGQQWINKNPEKVLLVVDAIDEIVQDGTSVNIDQTTPAKPFTIIRNLFREALYKGMWILSTSRWQWILDFQINLRIGRSELPARGIVLRGFSYEVVTRLLSGYVGENKRHTMKNILARYPGFLHLCKIPMFTLYFATVLAEMPHTEETMLSQPSIVMNALLHLKSNVHAIPHGPEGVQTVMELAYKSMSFAKDEDQTFSYTEIANMADLDHGKMEHFVLAQTDPKHFKAFAEFITKHDLRYSFRSDILRDMLAALYVITRNKDTFKNIVSKQTINGNVQNLVFGTVMDANLEVLVTKFTEDSNIDFTAKRKFLRKLLTARITNPLTDLGEVHLLYECKGFDMTKQKLPGKKMVFEIKLENAPDPCDGHAVLSVFNRYDQIKSINVGHLCIDATSLNLVQGDIEAKSLTISGEMLPSEIERMRDIMRKTPGVKNVHLQHHSLEYSTENKTVKLSESKCRFDVLLGFLHHNASARKVIIKDCHVSGNARNVIEKFDNLGDLEKHCELEVKTLHVSAIPSVKIREVVEMLEGSPKRRLGRLILGRSSITVEHDSEGQYVHLVGRLNDSDSFVKLVSEGICERLVSDDFKITIFARKDLDVSVTPEADLKSYKTLCSFMIKLKSHNLFCRNLQLNAIYNAKSCQKLVLTTNKDSDNKSNCLKAMCQFVMESKVKTARIGNYEFVKVQTEDETHLELETLHGSGIVLLEHLLNLSDIVVLTVHMCCLTKYSDIGLIKNMGKQIKLTIREITAKGELLSYAKNLYTIITSVNISTATISSADEGITTISLGNISIQKIKGRKLIGLFSDVIPVAAVGLKISIGILSVSQERTELDDLRKKVQRSVGRNISTKITEMEIKRNFAEIPRDLEAIIRSMRVEKVTTLTTNCQVDYDTNGKVQILSFRDVDLSDLYDFLCISPQVGSVRARSCLVPECDDVRDVQRWLTEFSNVLQQPCQCLVETLQVKAPLNDVLHNVLSLVKNGLLNRLIAHHSNMDQTITLNCVKKIFRLTVSRIDANELETFYQELRGFVPDELVVDRCDVGTRNQASLRKGIEMLPDMTTAIAASLLEALEASGTNKKNEDMKALRRFRDLYPNDLQVKSLHVNGDIGDFKLLLDIMKDVNILNVYSNDATMARSTTQSKVRLEQLKFDELLRTEPLLDAGWEVVVECLDLTYMNTQYFAKTQELVQRHNIMVNLFKTPTNLLPMIDELAVLVQLLKPAAVNTGDYIMKLRWYGDHTEFIVQHRHGGDLADFKVFASKVDRAWCLETEIYYDECDQDNLYEEQLETVPKEFVYSSEETRPKEITGQGDDDGCVDGNNEPIYEDLLPDDSFESDSSDFYDNDSCYEQTLTWNKL